MTCDPALPPILLIDDDADDQVLTQRLLVRAGVRHRLVPFYSGNAVLEYLRVLAERPRMAVAEWPAAIVTDGNMPGLDGSMLIAHLRAIPAFAFLPIVMLSGSERREDRERAIACGANAYFVKFPPAERLVAAILPVVSVAS